MNQPLFQRILFATDMSDNAVHAARYAVRLAHDHQAQLTVVNVVTDEIEEMSANMRYDLAAHCDQDCLDAIGSDTVKKGKEALTERIRTVYSEIIDSIDGCQVHPEVAIRAGDPVQQIVDEARICEADLIITGARGHGLLDEILVGSVARGVVKKSPVPVLTIPLPKR